MHTVIVLAVGFGLLVLCALVGRLVDGPSGIAAGALVFSSAVVSRSEH